MPLGGTRAIESLLLHHPLHLPIASTTSQRQATAFSEWSCPRWTGEACDGDASVCKRGSTDGREGHGLSCVEKRCVCQEHSCYVAGHCVQDGCHVAAAQVAAIQSAGGITAPTAQLAAIRAGKHIEDQSVMEQSWMPAKVQYMWTAEAEKRLKADSGLSEKLESHRPVVNTPLSQEQIKIIQQVKGKALSDPTLRDEMDIKEFEKVAYVWTGESKQWVEDQKASLASALDVDPFDKSHAPSKYHIEVGQPLSLEQVHVLNEKFPDWKTNGNFEAIEEAPATYHWKTEGIAKFRNEFPRAYEETAAHFGPLGPKKIVQDSAKEAFEERYGTMERIPMFDNLFAREEGLKVTHGSNEPLQLSDVQATISMPVYLNDVAKPSGDGVNLEGVLNDLKNASQNLTGLAEHKLGIKASIMDIPSIILAGFTPAPRFARLPRQQPDVELRSFDAKARWRQFFPLASLQLP